MSDPDIVARLRIATLPSVCCVKREAADEIERLRELSGYAGQLREERDEARREVCAFASGRYRKDVVTLDRAAAIAEAELRGWDCFEEVKK